MDGELFSGLSALLTAGGLFYAGRQFQLSRQLARHQFMLQLFEKMDSHNELHEKTSKFGEDLKNWPETKKDWIEVGRILGLFERISQLVEDKILTIDQVDLSFSYRIVPIMAMGKVRSHVYNSNNAWKGLLSLVRKLEYQPVYSKLMKEIVG